MKCRGCDTELPPDRPGKRGTKRQWCTDRCRKLTLYSRPCADCGKPLSGGDGFGPDAPERCVQCAAIERTRWTREAVIAAIQDWNTTHGMPPTAQDWNTTVARQIGRPDRGEGYPPTGTVQRVFGSWNAGLDAAGIAPCLPGVYRTRRHTKDELRAEVVRLYRAGMTCAEVGAQLGIADNTAWYHLSIAGEPRRAPGRRPRAVVAA